MYFNRNLKKALGVVCSIMLVSCTTENVSDHSDNVDVASDSDTKTHLVEEDEVEENEFQEHDLTTHKEDDKHYIYVATDTHLLSNNINDKGAAFSKAIESGDGTQLYYSNEIFSAFADGVIEEKPDYLIISGDLTYNGSRASHEDVVKQLKYIEDNGIEVFVIPGNHDINNPWAREFKGSETSRVRSVNPEEFVELYSDFGYGEAFLKDKNSLSYVATPSEDLWILMLDTTMHSNNKDYPVTNGMLKSETLDWIDKCSSMAKENGAEVLTVMHHNLYNHSSLLNRGFTLDNSSKVLSTFKENDLDLVLSGHIHIQDIKTDDENEVYDIATSSLIAYPVQYGKLIYEKGHGFQYESAKVKVEEWAKSKNVRDNNLLNFDEYVKEYFYNKSYYMAYDEIVKSGEYTDEQAVMMSDYMARLNLHYFAGTVSKNKDELLNDEAYTLWQNADSGLKFTKQYVISMLDDSVMDGSRVHIDMH